MGHQEIEQDQHHRGAHHDVLRPVHKLLEQGRALQLDLTHARAAAHRGGLLHLLGRFLHLLDRLLDGPQFLLHLTHDVRRPAEPSRWREP